MQKLNLDLLPIAFALYDERSVSRAAKSLGMSQPAVSMALRKLRSNFNDPLFIRAPNGVAPTPRAHALVKASRPLLERLHEDLLSEKDFEPAQSTRVSPNSSTPGWRRGRSTTSTAMHCALRCSPRRDGSLDTPPPRTASAMPTGRRSTSASSR